MAYRFLYGVTEYPIEGNSTLLKNLQDNDINYVGTAAEGGLSNKMLVAGHMLDGNPFNYWYSVAWCAINLELIWLTKSSTVRTPPLTRCTTSRLVLTACKTVHSKRCVLASVTA
jgi:hypothetical protein